VGELHPRWRQAWELAQAPVLFELELDACCSARCPRSSRCPSTSRWSATSLWWWRSAVTHAALMGAIWAALPTGLLRDAVLFDVFRPKQWQGRAGRMPGWSA
jgi:phenylalanyl-tRNA synthetase beta chain